MRHARWRTRISVLALAGLALATGIVTTGPAYAAAIALRGTPSVTTNAAPTTSQAFTTPAAAVAGDELVAVLDYKTQNLSDIANTAPAGWTKVPGEAVDCGSSTTCAHLVVATKTAAGGAESANWTFATAPAGLVLTVIAYSGVDNASPFDRKVYGVETRGSAAVTMTHTAPSFTPTVSGTWGVAFFGARASETWTPGTGLVERTDARAATSAQATLETNDSNGALTVGVAKSYSSTEPTATTVVTMFAGNLRPATTPPPQSPPTVTTGAASGISQTTATVNGTVNPNGAATTCHFDYGLTTSYGSSTPNDTSPASGTSAVPVSANITGLTPGTLHHFRLVCSNNGGTTNGLDATFTTSAAPSCQPSGECMPVGDLPGWHQTITEDFTVDSALGSWGTACDGNHVDYIGATGTKWRSYPQCYADPAGRAYRSDQVLSTHDGVLDFFLNDNAGAPAGANPSPMLTPGSSSYYQTYGRFSARFKVDPNLSDYRVAWLLWPHVDADWQCAESDYPEGALTSETFGAFHHYGCSGSQASFSTGTIDKTQWHTYTQEWGPGFRKYYLDGALIGSDTTHPVYSLEQRWQFQTETRTMCCTGADGHLLVDWAVAYTYAP